MLYLFKRQWVRERLKFWNFNTDANANASADDDEMQITRFPDGQGYHVKAIVNLFSYEKSDLISV